MGYLSWFEILFNSNQQNAILKTFNEIVGLTGYSSDDFSINNEHSIGYAHEWICRDLQMQELSIRFPNVIFTVTRYGSGYKDIERTYYRNGKYYTIEAQITFDSFDERNLT